jgi:hypothetical protein
MNGWGCGCSSGFSSLCYEVDRPDVATAEMCICSLPGCSTCSFQGAFSQNSKCLTPNPFTGDCSCSSDVSKIGPISLGALQSSMYWCAQTSDEDNFGGLFQTNSLGSCIVGNPFASDGCGCDSTHSYCGSREITKTSVLGFCSSTQSPSGSVQLSISASGFTKTLQKASKQVLFSFPFF